MISKITKFLYASVLQLDSGTIDHEKTNIAKKIKKFTARTNGNLNDSLMSACFYATKKGYLDGNNHEMYVYQGNSYMQSVWRVTWKKSEALNPINNTGLGLYTVTPDLTITYYTIPDRVKKRKEMDKSLKKLDKKSSTIITEKDIPTAINHWTADRNLKWYGEWFLKDENEPELKQALDLWNDIDEKIKSIIGKINFDKNDLIRQILGTYNSEKLDGQTPHS
jgi:hypothetical protein